MNLQSTQPQFNINQSTFSTLNYSNKTAQDFVAFVHSCHLLLINGNTKFEYFAHLASKCLLTPLLGVLGVKWGMTISAFLSFYECINLELTSYETNCVKSFLWFSLQMRAKFWVTKKPNFMLIGSGVWGI